MVVTAQEIEYIEADGEYLQLSDSQVNVIDDTEEHWDQDHIKQMLNLYLQNIERFRNPKTKKKNVWQDIASDVGKGPDSCDKKFRNLKQTYIRLVKKKNTSGETSVKWPYFTLFEKIFNENGEYNQHIQQKLEESSESVAKALLTLNTPRLIYDPQSISESATSRSEDSQKRLNKKRYADFKKVAVELKERQRTVEAKLDRLINIVEQSNEIQIERNRLFEKFLDKLNQNM